jgi:hypothetical protein
MGSNEYDRPRRRGFRQLTDVAFAIVVVPVAAFCTVVTQGGLATSPSQSTVNWENVTFSTDVSARRMNESSEKDSLPSRKKVVLSMRDLTNDASLTTEKRRLLFFSLRHFFSSTTQRQTWNEEVLIAIRQDH